MWRVGDLQKEWQPDVNPLARSRLYTGAYRGCQNKGDWVGYLWTLVSMLRVPWKDYH